MWWIGLTNFINNNMHEVKYCIGSCEGQLIYVTHYISGAQPKKRKK